MDNDFLKNDEDDLSFEFKRKDISDLRREKNWDGISNKIVSEKKTGRTFTLRTFAITGIAAIFIVLAGIYLFNEINGNGDAVDYKTDYANLKRLQLPDGSVVIMNANSELRIDKKWDDINTREVWLSGEAYFTVSKKPATHQKFVVHTQYADIEVLGTKFNVNTRRDQFLVSLEEGKIRLSINPETKKRVEKIKSVPSLEINPGDVVTIDTASGMKIQKQTDIQTHSSWVNKDFHFDNTSLSEIGKTIADVYGYTMILNDTTLAERKITGDLHIESLNDLAKVLEITLRVNIEINSKTREFIIDSQK